MDTSDDIEGTHAAIVPVVDAERPVFESVTELLEPGAPVLFKMPFDAPSNLRATVNPMVEASGLKAVFTATAAS